MKIILFAVCGILIGVTSHAQHLIFPDSVGWNILNEGKSLHFKVWSNEGRLKKYTIEGVGDTGIQFDSLGYFTWTPSYNFVDRLAKVKEVPVIFQAEWKDGRRARHQVTFVVNHVNRPPVVEDLPIVYVKGGMNHYQIPTDYVNDPDGDPLVFKSIPSDMPEGSTLSSGGLFSWNPSRSQFVALKGNPITIPFIVEDQPDKAVTTGKLKIAQTQLDLPPEILLVPGDSVVSIDEDDLLNIKIYVSDPNGDEDVKSLDFLSSDGRVPKGSLRVNTPTQAEFTWTPGYGFTDDGEKIKEVTIIFFALDKFSNRTQRKVKILVTDAINIEELDKQLYQKYRNTLIMAKALLDRLDKNQKALDKSYKQAKKGKRHRSVANISLGATTGISPVVLPTNDSKYVSGIGGTAVATLGTMETTQLIGKSTTDILDKQKTNADIRNSLSIEGGNFSRKYALKSNRRLKEMDTDRDKLVTIVNDPRLITLELDAGAAAYPRIDDKDLKKTFPDFSLE
jgi:hypothetical protein